MGVRWLGDDLGDDDPSPGTRGIQTTLEARAGDALKAKLLGVFRSPGYAPPVLPRVAVELMALTRRANVNLADVGRLLGQDPLIAAAVLRYAQSPVYSRGAPVQSLDDAVVRLGLVTVRDILFEALTTSRVFRVPGYDEPMERLRSHSVATAHIARLVCQQARLREDHAFLCGLLHDAGIVAAVIALSETGATVADLATSWPTIAAIHEEAGATLCRMWGLPDVAVVVGGHHGPAVGEPFSRLAALVRVAELVACELGIGLDEHDEDPAWAVDGLQLSSAAIAAITADARSLQGRSEQR